MAESKTPKTHPLVAALQPDSSKPPIRAVKLFGFPGPAPEARTTRLWLDTDLHRYVDIPSGDILHSTTLPEDAGTLLWVSPDAKLVYGSTSGPASAAQFLSGAIADQHLSGAAGGLAGKDAPFPHAISLGQPCLSLPNLCTPSLSCPSQHACPSLSAPCLSVTCPSHGTVCPTVVACPTHTAPCLSIGCPSIGACPTHLVPCPTHEFLCHPSVGIVCASREIVCRPSLTPCLTVVTVCPSHGAVCPSSPVICDISALTCPTRACPSGNLPCVSAPCPTGFCPSIACGGNPQGGGAQ